MPIDVLRCRVCESEYPAAPNGICARCFGPLDPVRAIGNPADGDSATATARASGWMGAIV